MILLREITSRDVHSFLWKYLTAISTMI